MGGGTYEHFEGVEGKLDSADGRWKVGLHVRVLATSTQNSSLGESGWHDAKINPDLDRLAVLVGLQDEGVVVAELESNASWHLLLEEGVVVCLVQDNLLLGQSHVLEHLLKVECPLAEVIVRLEKVEVPSLHHQK